MPTQRRPPLYLTKKSARSGAASPGAVIPSAPRPEDTCQLVAVETVKRRGRSPHQARRTSRLRRFEFLLPICSSFSIEDVHALVLNITWGERESTQLFSAEGPHALVWAPAEARASLVVEVHDVPPAAEDFGEWDHAAEFSLALPSGRLRVLTDMVSDPPVLRVHPGPHRVRLSIGGLASVGVEDGRPVGGYVRYRLALWPRDFSESVVMKQRSGAAYP